MDLLWQPCEDGGKAGPCPGAVGYVICKDNSVFAERIYIGTGIAW